MVVVYFIIFDSLCEVLNFYTFLFLVSMFIVMLLATMKTVTLCFDWLDEKINKL